MCLQPATPCASSLQPIEPAACSPPAPHQVFGKNPNPNPNPNPNQVFGKNPHPNPNPDPDPDPNPDQVFGKKPTIGLLDPLAGRPRSSQNARANQNQAPAAI